MIDVIILTDNTDPETTQKTIDSIKLGVDAQIILVSKREQYRIYKGVNTYVVIKEQFNYNRFINQALEYVVNEWVLISNDDVEYDPQWFSEMEKIMEEKSSIESFSPMDPRLHERYYNDTFHFPKDYVEGYSVTRHVSGWSILIKKSALDTITPLDEQFDMYYQDNDFSESLKKKKIKHALVKRSVALHKGTELVGKPYSETMIKKLEEDEQKFRNKWNIWI
jgi:GT2 family glycosyltransferase